MREGRRGRRGERKWGGAKVFVLHECVCLEVCDGGRRVFGHTRAGVGKGNKEEEEGDGRWR